MAKHVLSFCVAAVLGTAGISASLSAAVLEPIATTGHDQDIVFEAGLTAGQVGANGELGSRQFFEAGVFADGVPQGVTNFVSVLTSNTITFAFQPFTQNNILKFENTSPPKTLTLTTPAAYSQLAIVHSSGSLAITPAVEVAIMTYTINYSGGVTQTGSVNSVDWGAVPTLPSGTERFLIADRTTANATTWPVSSDNNTTANRWAIYLSEVTPSRPDLNIDSITFGPITLNGGPLNSGDDVVVFGLAGEPGNVVVEPPVITNQPVSITVIEAQPATFTVGASGSPLFYQWLRGGVAIAGANRASYTIPAAVFPGDNGAQFSVIVSNSLNSVTSSVATLTVQQDLTPPVVISAIGDLDLTRIRLMFSEPLDPATVSESSFVLFLTGGEADGSYITFFATLTNGTNVTLTTDPRAPGTNYSVQILDVRDASSGHNAMNPNPTVVPIRPTVQLIGFDTDNEWKYDINNGDRTGSGWETVAFDDSNWPSGPAGVGHDVAGNGVPIRTDIPYMTNGVVTYFRKHFNLPGSTNGVVLALRDVVEDGAVYYLNGQEVFRNRMPTGAVTFATLAAGAPDPTPIAGPFSLPIANLVSGDNVLAVEVHQSAANSSDVELAVELTATLLSYSALAPRLSFVRNANGSITLTWNAPGFCLQETTVLAGGSTVWSPGTVTSGVPFTPVGPAKFYRLNNTCP